MLGAKGMPPPTAPAAKGGRGSKIMGSSGGGRGGSSSLGGRGSGRGGSGLSLPESPATGSTAEGKRAAPGFEIGAEHAEEESTDENSAGASKRAKVGTVGLRGLSAQELSSYYHAKYEERKQSSLATWKKLFPWLMIHDEKGFVCRVCFTSTVKAQDKLSTEGFGFTGEGDERTANAIPSKQKLTNHEGKDSHKYNAKNDSAVRGGTSKAAITGDTKFYLTVSPSPTRTSCTRARFAPSTSSPSGSSRSTTCTTCLSCSTPTAW